MEPGKEDEEDEDDFQEFVLMIRDGRKEKTEAMESETKTKIAEEMRRLVMLMKKERQKERYP